jgi:hypothetical protein
MAATVEQLHRSAEALEDMTMSFGLLFWILMLLWFIFGMWSHFGAVPYGPLGSNLLLFILLLLLGWKVFGAALHP